ncbi:MAG: response regulator [Gemmatimonadaceae bacterium]|nr:response regulator [Gemmatimonadaceae bacterium]
MTVRRVVRAGSWPLRNLRTLLAADHVLLFVRDSDRHDPALALADPPQLPSQPFTLEHPALWPEREPVLLLDADRIQRSPIGWVLAGARGSALGVSAPAMQGDGQLALYVLWQEPHQPPAHVLHDPGTVAAALREQLDFVEAASDNRHARIRLDVLLASLQEGIVLTDAEHGTALVNEAASELLDIPSGVVPAATIAQGMRGLHERMSNARDVEQEAEQLFSSSDGVRLNWVWDVLHPRRRTLLVNTRPVRSPRHRGRLWSFHDVTALQAAEAEQIRLMRQLERERAHLTGLLGQLQQSQKMEAMGRLTGGVAHDFNNLLTVIGGNTELLLAELPPTTQAHADAEEVRAAVQRAADLTRQLLHFSRREVLQRHLVEPDQIVRGVQQLLRRVIGEQIALEVHTGLGTSTVEIDGGQLEQVLVNLSVNARDAMPDGGRLSIRTEISQEPVPPAAQGQCVTRGTHARVIVQDTGAGMDADTLARACEPFFTTKAEGQGTGIGLATVQEIVQANGGCLWLDSAVGVGTTVTIAFPLASGAATEPVSVADEVPATGAGTVLLVEDEEGVRQIAQRILRDAGYDVLVATNGQDGLRCWRECASAGQGIDLVISDVVMPTLGGRRMLELLRAEAPALPAIFMSGYVEGGLTDKDLTGPTRFLGKPFTRRELLREVRALLQRAAD